MTDGNWFSQAGNLGNSSGGNNTPERPTSSEPVPTGTTGSAGPSFIKPVKGLKTGPSAPAVREPKPVYAKPVFPVPVQTEDRCRKCGAVVPKGTTLCWKCTSSQSNADKKLPKKKNNLPLVIILCVVGIAVLGGGVFVALKLFGKKEPPKEENSEIKQYYEENAEIISVTPVKDSGKTPSEKDVISDLKARGFTSYPITTKYSLNGSFDDSKEVSGTSDEKHPIYETYYYTSDGNMWVITVIDGAITAYPSSYNLEHSDSVPVMVSESKEILSYDSSTNSFYKTVPKSTVLNVRVVDKINTQTLEALKLEG